MHEVLSSLPEGGYLLLGMVLQTLIHILFKNYTWSGEHMLPITRRLIRAAGWRGMVASLGLTLLPDTLLSPMGVLKGVGKKEKAEAAPKTETPKGPVTKFFEPGTLQAAILNAVLRLDIESYNIHRTAEGKQYLKTTLILGKEDTPWLM